MKNQSKYIIKLIGAISSRDIHWNSTLVWN